MHVVYNEMRQTVVSCLKMLDSRGSQIVCAYIGLGDTEPMTQQEIGDAIGVTRQLRNRALEKMKAECGGLLVEVSSN